VKPVLVIDVVGLSPSLIGPDTPHLAALAARGFSAPLEGVLPAVTCSAQSTMLTGRPPREHGIVGNGWYFRDLAQVWLWRQSNHLVEGPKVWHELRERAPDATVLNMFWWYAMYADVDFSMTPRPLYLADGRKLPGTYGWPKDFRRDLEAKMPTFPLFNFWGPAAGYKSSAWITEASIEAMRSQDPTLSLVYLPHLDYEFQRVGPHHERSRVALREADELVGRLVDFADESNRDVIVVSEYGIEEVDQPVHINRALRRAGYLETTPKLAGEDFDAGASRAFALADHQLAHVYVRDADDLSAVRRLLEELTGVASVLDRSEQSSFGLDHPRSGELVAVAEKGAWFTYYFWEDDALAPDYARTVDIHSKPGYDPVELFLDPQKKLAPLRIAGKVLRKKLGFRMTMDLIPLDANLVRGSHGRIPDDPEEGAILIGSRAAPRGGPWAMTQIKDLILSYVFDTEA
jgi:predicted AlkP superfamily pyrophosphatase or phosphodiesterase